MHVTLKSDGGGLAPATWQDILGRLHAVFAPPLRPKSTWYSYRRAIELMAEYAPTPAMVDEATIGTITRTLLERGLRKATVNSHLRFCRAVCNYLVRRHYLAVSPFEGVRLFLRVPASDRIKIAHRPADMVAVLDQADRELDAALLQGKWRPSHESEAAVYRAGRLRALTYLVSYTGLRAREALYLRCEHVDVAERTVRVTEEDRRCKTTASAAPVPLPTEAVKVIGDWLSQQQARGRKFLFGGIQVDKPWDNCLQRYTPTQQLRRLAERGGVSGMTLASLRHTFCTVAKLLWGLNSEEAKQILRHTSVETQAHYTHEDLTHLIERVRDFSYRREIA